MYSMGSTPYYHRYSFETEMRAALAIHTKKASGRPRWTLRILRAFGTWTAWRWARSGESIEEEVQAGQGQGQGQEQE
jgi:hypothetical protein